MSDFNDVTRHPISKQWEIARWFDNHFGDHNYGVWFSSDDKTYDAREYDMPIKGQEKYVAEKTERHEAARLAVYQHAEALKLLAQHDRGVKSKKQLLLDDVLKGKFGTKNRMELIGRLEQL